MSLGLFGLRGASLIGSNLLPPCGRIAGLTLLIDRYRLRLSSLRGCLPLPVDCLISLRIGRFTLLNARNLGGFTATAAAAARLRAVRGRILTTLALRILGSARSFSLLARLLANALGIRMPLSRRALMLGAFRKLDPHVRAVLANGDALELAEKLREQVCPKRAHVEVGVTLEQAASHLAQTRRLPVVLVVGDDVDDCALDFLDGQAR